MAQFFFYFLNSVDAKPPPPPLPNYVHVKNILYIVRVGLFEGNVYAVLQSKQDTRSSQDSINELIIWKMNSLVVPVTGVKFKSELLHA